MNKQEFDREHSTFIEVKEFFELVEKNRENETVWQNAYDGLSIGAQNKIAEITQIESERRGL